MSINKVLLKHSYAQLFIYHLLLLRNRVECLPNMIWPQTLKIHCLAFYRKSLLISAVGNFFISSALLKALQGTSQPQWSLLASLCPAKWMLSLWPSWPFLDCSTLSTLRALPLLKQSFPPTLRDCLLFIL